MESDKPGKTAQYQRIGDRADSWYKLEVVFVEENFFKGVVWALVFCLPFWIAVVFLILFF